MNGTSPLQAGRMRSIRVLPLLAGLLLVPLVQTVGAAEADSSAPLATEVPALEEQQHVIMREWGTTKSEAKRRLAQQPAVGDLQTFLAENYSDVLGGVWIDHENDARVMVATTELGLTRVVAKSQHRDLAPDIDEVLVSRSITTLRKLQQQIAELDSETKLPYATSRIEQESNRVIVLLSPAKRASRHYSDFRTGLDAIVAANPRAVAVQEVADEPGDDACSVTACDAPLRGGIRLGNCSAGFPARENAGALFVMTAGHCDPPSAGVYQHNGKTVGPTAREFDEAATSSDTELVSVSRPWDWSPTG